ncbi:FecR family protein [Chitinophaga arvensicola]|uniref:Ferric-dicitrate binding protein FerR, regulates iron transport through sigma-19 n=1 Tax=Chitinophaga arvensicola TaxID=29529 RepID=A0A1I0S790_9BACT|nr:FecR family protein [Chitinophaga arvensicola]SEW51614.1 ferric-dicitrate binding protein FerR, regulates iron transport through sigma-19 [Chitinophaga arvensicola]
MNKDQLSALFGRFLREEASPHEKKMVEAYMLLSESEEAEFSDREKQETKERIWSVLNPYSGERRSNNVWYANRSWWLRTAAVWVMLVGITAAGFLFRYDIMDRLFPIAWNQDITGPYEIKRVVLPDGTVVNLAPNSTISYPARYRGHARKARLSGIAFFSVVSNEKQPFTVASGNLDIRVLGTSFEVRNVPLLHDVGVTVATGKVQVRCGDRMQAVLTANQEVRYNDTVGQFSVMEKVDAAAETAWTRNVLVFRETGLEEVLKALEDRYGMKISIHPNAIKKGATFSGAFKSHESGKEILDVVCFSSGLKYTITRDNIAVITK